MNTYSRFDGTCNPEGPTHWFKKFLDQNAAEVYRQSYTIDDNPFCPPEVAARMKREYAGTVYFDRYILGRWVAAEGAVYRVFADAPEPNPRAEKVVSGFTCRTLSVVSGLKICGVTLYK